MIARMPPLHRQQPLTGGSRGATFACGGPLPPPFA